MKEKNNSVRHFVLGMLESGALAAGDKLPGAREIARQTGKPLPAVQGELEMLVQEGVLETAARKGTFVHPLWSSRILQRNLSLFRAELPWLEDFRRMAGESLPELWISEQFPESVFEIQTTHYVQSHHNEYMDLNELFADCFPDTSDFFLKTFDAFRVGPRLTGIPIIYSPRVIFYNPRLFRQAGCPTPGANWSIDEFRECIRRLRTILPPVDTFCWHTKQFYWINFILRSGGCLIDPGAEDCVKIDSPETRRGLKLFRQLRHDMGIGNFTYPDDFEKNFLSGRAGMLIQPREFMSEVRKSGFRDWSTAPLPLIEGGANLNAQATDVFCVRRECVDLNLAARLLKLLLSEEFQSCLVDWSYGLPIRKSLMGSCVDYSDERDTLFLAEIPHMHSHYNLDSVEVYNLVCDGIADLMAGDEDIDKGTADLAGLLRTYLKIRNATARSA